MGLFTSSKKKESNPKGKNDKKKDESYVKAVAIPKTVQQSIPYIRVYDDSNTNGGIIETSEGVFTKSYFLNDANYSDVGDDKQEEILEILERIFNTFSPENTYQITVNNRTIDQKEFNKRVLMDYKQDGHDDLRIEHNDVVMIKMQEGKNNLKSEKYLTIGVSDNNIEAALERFNSIEKDVNIKFKQINQTGLIPISLQQRLEILHDLYNINHEGEFNKYFDLQTMLSQGLRTKDLIGPNFMDTSNNKHLMLNDTYARTLYLKHTPSSLTSVLIESLSSISANVCISVFYDMQPQEKAVSFASAQVTNVGGEVAKAQKNLSKAGASPELISQKLDTAQKDARELLAEITENSQSLFHVTLVATVFAENIEDLDLYTEQIKTRAKEHVCKLEILDAHQEQGFNSMLPLAHNFLSAHRILTTKSAVALQPFATQELQNKNGIYYGLNQLSKNLLVYDRREAANQNGVILGCPGGGKSFAAKMEMYQAYLNNDNTQIFIIDPEQEYKILGETLNATIIPIEPGGDYHVNPLDLDITKDTDGDPFAQKVDFVICIIERMLGGRGELSGYLKSIIDQTLQVTYQPYIQSLQKRGLTIDTEMCPTLQDFYENLKSRKEGEARDLADSIQMYCTGTLNIFAHHTNINTKNRMIIYDTKNIGANLQELGMQICLNDIWNRMVANKKRQVRTWFYIDEFYLMLQQPSAAKYMQMIWKRARKWMGSPTGITQNVDDLLKVPEGVTILQTSDFALLLRQASLDRTALATIYDISEEQQEYINTTAAPGSGLIVTPKVKIPFENIIPESSTIYKLCSTKPEEETKEKKIS